MPPYPLCSRKYRARSWGGFQPCLRHLQRIPVFYELSVPEVPLAVRSQKCQSGLAKLFLCFGAARDNVKHWTRRRPLTLTRAETSNNSSSLITAKAHAYHALSLILSLLRHLLSPLFLILPTRLIDYQSSFPWVPNSSLPPASIFFSPTPLSYTTSLCHLDFPSPLT